MARGDGDGWVACRCGTAHWGRFGAAGLVLLRPARPGPRTTGGTVTGEITTGDGSTDDGSTAEVLLQLRAAWTHQGGAWGVPGGARDSDEDDVAAALREAAEEAAVLPGRVRVTGTAPGLDHGDWAYRYVLAVVEPGAPAVGDADGVLRPRTTESTELRWVPVGEVDTLPLHDGFRAAWPGLAAETGRVLAAAGDGTAAGG
jgi:8-oxo-dGTP diphosphatase